MSFKTMMAYLLSRREMVSKKLRPSMDHMIDQAYVTYERVE